MGCCAAGARAHLVADAYPTWLAGQPCDYHYSPIRDLPCLHIFTFHYCIMILSGISVDTKMSKDERCLLAVDAARAAAAAFCSRLASGCEQRFSLIYGLEGWIWLVHQQEPWARVSVAVCAQRNASGSETQGKKCRGCAVTGPEGWEVGSSRPRRSTL